MPVVVAHHRDNKHDGKMSRTATVQPDTYKHCCTNAVVQGGRTGKRTGTTFLQDVTFLPKSESSVFTVVHTWALDVFSENPTALALLKAKYLEVLSEGYSWDPARLQNEGTILAEELGGFFITVQPEFKHFIFKGLMKWCTAQGNYAGAKQHACNAFSNQPMHRLHMLQYRQYHALYSIILKENTTLPFLPEQADGIHVKDVRYEVFANRGKFLELVIQLIAQQRYGGGPLLPSVDKDLYLDKFFRPIRFLFVPKRSRDEVVRCALRADKRPSPRTRTPSNVVTVTVAPPSEVLITYHGSHNPYAPLEMKDSVVQTVERPHRTVDTTEGK